MSDDALYSRVVSLRIWCNDRIQSCRRTEANLGPLAAATYEAAAVRQTLVSVLEILEYTGPRLNQDDLRYRGTAAAARPMEPRE